MEKENNEAHEVVNQLRDDVVKKQNEIIKEKKEQDKLRKDVEQAETENTDLGKQISQLEKKVTDQRLRYSVFHQTCNCKYNLLFFFLVRRTPKNYAVSKKLISRKNPVKIRLFKNELIN